jgi:membrane protein implicated in regulation of membrane protease activity
MAKLVFLLPLVGLIVFWFFSLPLAGGIYGILLVVSVVLYFAAAQPKAGPSKVGIQEMIGESGVVRKWTANEGLIEVHDELWEATSPEFLHEGDRVEIVNVDGLHLRVKRALKKK